MVVIVSDFLGTLAKGLWPLEEDRKAVVRPGVRKWLTGMVKNGGVDQTQGDAVLDAGLGDREVGIWR